MYILKRTPEFATWLDTLSDRTTRVRLIRRLDRLASGNPGDVKSVGDGVFEMREHFGPGWRMYYVQRGEIVIVMLGGGDKSTQATDIAKALALAAQIEN